MDKKIVIKNVDLQRFVKLAEVSDGGIVREVLLEDGQKQFSVSLSFDGVVLEFWSVPLKETE